MILNSKLTLLVILLTAAVLRLFQLGSIPPSLDWDEVSLGYNAYSILKTGADEYGNFLPFAIRSFNDYKPPLYTYLTIPSIFIFGLTEFAVRLPSALAGIVAVWTTYHLVLELFHQHKQKNLIAILTSLLLAISPWHLQFSRAAFEANLALTFYIIFVWQFVAWINQTTQKKLFNDSNHRTKFFSTHLIISSLSAIAALYSYHSVRLVLPLMALFLAIAYYRTLNKNFRQVFIACILGVLFISPLIYISTRGDSNSRFNTVSFLTNPGQFSRESERLDRIALFRTESPRFLRPFHFPQTVYLKLIARNYLEHFNFDFLFLKGDGNTRHTPLGMGMLYLIEFPFILIGIHYLTTNSFPHKKLIWAWFFLAPAAASITTHTPHAIRSLLFLPTFQIFTALGLLVTNEWIKLNLKKAKYPFFGICNLLFVIFFLTYLNLYYTISPSLTSHDWQYGYKELVAKISKLEGSHDQIYITNKYDQPHIFFAFYQQIDPKVYQTFAADASNGFGKYHFQEIEYGQLRNVPNAIIIAQPDRSPVDSIPIDQVHFLNGEVAFNIYSTK